MNATEQRAHRWLVKQGYDPEHITFRSRSTPDFLTSDGKGWEAKLVRHNTIAFSLSQIPALVDHPDCSVMLFADTDEPLAVIPMTDLAIPGYWHQYRLIASDMGQQPGITLNIRKIKVATVERMKRSAQMRGMTLPQYLDALSDFHDAARARADAGGDDWQVELETRGLQTVRG